MISATSECHGCRFRFDVVYSDEEIKNVKRSTANTMVRNVCPNYGHGNWFDWWEIAPNIVKTKW